jgi:excisionase family DNA binding protein
MATTVAQLKKALDGLRLQLDALEVLVDQIANEPEQRPMTIREAAERYRVAAHAVRQAVRSGELVAMMGRRQQALVRTVDLEAWLEGKKIRPRAPVEGKPSRLEYLLATAKPTVTKRG